MAYAPGATVIATPLGPVRITAEGEQVTAIGIGDLTPGTDESPLLREAATQMRAYFEGRLQRFDLPLASAGTPRRGEIWAAMQDIDFGQFATYGELAARLGSSARAVGQACRHNPLPIVIPCHRVLQSGYRLGAYSGGEGPDTKRKLLAHERAEGWLL